MLNRIVVIDGDLQIAASLQRALPGSIERNGGVDIAANRIGGA